ncbi:hypothetical protein FB451DRAFT_1520495 [Mycena latifolia]|nr:hypothetical protein FB451DRAFT_1520495 [Mycena latifolia]
MYRRCRGSAAAPRGPAPIVSSPSVYGESKSLRVAHVHRRNTREGVARLAAELAVAGSAYFAFTIPPFVCKPITARNTEYRLGPLGPLLTGIFSPAKSEVDVRRIEPRQSRRVRKRSSSAASSSSSLPGGVASGSTRSGRSSTSSSTVRASKHTTAGQLLDRFCTCFISDTVADDAVTSPASYPYYSAYPHYPPTYPWQHGPSAYPFPYTQYPATPQATPSLAALAGNPYAALVTPSPLGRGPSNSSSQSWGPALPSSNPPQQDAPPFD